jgi:hypothetical protein
MSALNESAITLLNTTSIASLASVAATSLYTVPTGKKAVLFAAALETAGDVGASLAFTIGRSTAKTDFVGTTNGDNLDADEDIIWVLPVPSATPEKCKIYPAATIIQIDVTVAGNAVAGVVYLFGFLIDV